MSNVLAFGMQHQQQDEWCWAAVATSVAFFYTNGSTWTQCSVVNAEAGRNDCCENGSSRQCNFSWFLDRALLRVSHSLSSSSGPLSFPATCQEVNRGCPLGARIGWNGGGVHFVAVHGYDDSEVGAEKLNVGDPWYGPSVVAYDTFVSGYQGSGNWTDSYRTKP